MLSPTAKPMKSLAACSNELLATKVVLEFGMIGVVKFVSDDELLGEK